MLKQFTTFTFTNISGNTTVAEIPIKINITSRIVTGNFSTKNIPNASISIDIETKVSNISVSGVSDLTSLVPIIDSIKTKLLEIVEEIEA